MPSITTFPLLDVSVRSALLGDPIVEPVNVKSPTLTLAISLSTYALILCCVANCVALSLEKLSSSAMPVTVAPLANAKLVDKVVAPEMVVAPVTSSGSAMVIFEESAALMVVPLKVKAPATTFPVPPGVKVRSALLGVLIVEPVIVRSPKERSANDNVPEPSVFKN